MSETRLVSPSTSVVWQLWKATKRPSSLIDGHDEPAPRVCRSVEPHAPKPWTPLVEIDTLLVSPLRSVRTKTSALRFVSPGTRFVALLAKATNLPSPLIDELWVP